MKVLTLAGVGSRAIPNGLRESHGKRPFQEFYDERYYTKDAPKPAPPPVQEQPKKRSGLLSQPDFRPPSQVSPSPSFGSTKSGSVEEKDKDKKKKRRFLGF